MHSIRETFKSYWRVFRLTFVLFSLYLMGDAFYRWDGFSYYASFAEFVPSVALVTILWSFVAIIVALMIWITGSVVEWLCMNLKLNIRLEHFLLFLCILTVLSLLAWSGKRFFWQYSQTSFQLKAIVMSCVAFSAALLTWLFRGKMLVVQERITPLVWLFGVITFLSIPMVAFHTWGGHIDDTVSQGSVRDTEDGYRPNIILVTFDALTSRDMSVYGYQRSTTPFIREWSKNASLFLRAEADSNFTTPTTASLMTGKRSWTHQTYHIEGSKPVRNNVENLPLILKAHGYYNMAFVVNHRASVETLGIANAFDVAESPISFYSSSGRLDEIIWSALFRVFGSKIRLEDWILKNDFILSKLLSKISVDYSETIMPPEKAFNSFLTRLESDNREPFFAWIHLFPPHEPYLPPAPYMGMFDSSSELRTFKRFLKEFRMVRAFNNREFPQERLQTNVNRLRARYNESIKYCDRQFEEFMEGLAVRDKLKNTVIILSSDHGESFEHGYISHAGPHLYEQLTHIPLIIREPGQTEGRTIEGVVEQIDIPATILDLADIPVPSWMEGRSLVPLMRGKSLPARPAFSMNFQKNRSHRHEITNGTVAVWEGDYKLIYYLEKKKSLLFNLRHDPDELENLFDREPETGQRLLFLIQDNITKVNERIISGN